MKPDHVKAVQQSWALLDPIPDLAAELFYTNLFARHPSMRLLFKGDLDAQGSRLMAMFGKAVRELDNPAALESTLRALGRRHQDYGVTDQHYEAYGEALLRTLAQGLGTAYTPEVNEAWTAVFGRIRHLMVEATREAMV
jgi:hemoglobin-like flavoprotein